MAHPVTPRMVADRIADFLFRITSEYGRPMVLSVEDREEIAGYVSQVLADDFVSSPSAGYALPKERR